MYPILLKIGPLTLHTYGFFVAMGFLLALTWTHYEGLRRGLDPEIFHDLFFYVVVAALIGARFFYVVLNFGYFRQDFFSVFRLWQGGLVFYGGFLFAVPVFIWRIRRWQKPLLEILDVATPALVLAQAVGRLGCLAAGCCYGKSCELGISITFKNSLSHAPLHQALHPTQIYHALANLSIFLLIVIVSRISVRRGVSVVVYLLLYGALRFTIEFWRGDPRGFMYGFSTSQLISVGLIISGVMLWYIKVRKVNIV